MATVTWEVIEAWDCERAQKPAAIVEQRVYPSEILPETLENRYHVIACKCSLAMECNMAGIACKYSGLNPELDLLHDCFDVSRK